MKSLIDALPPLATTESDSSDTDDSETDHYDNDNDNGNASDEIEIDASVTDETSTPLSAEADTEGHEADAHRPRSILVPNTGEDAPQRTRHHHHEPRRNAHGRRKRVSFGSVHVREYERIVGDHPETRVGVPLAIGWAFYVDELYGESPGGGVSLDSYEAYRAVRGSRRRLRLSSVTRKNLLLHVFGVPIGEVQEAERRNHETSPKPSGSASMKKIGKKLRRGGVSLLKGMVYAAQFGLSSGGGGVSSAAAKAVF